MAPVKASPLIARKTRVARFAAALLQWGGRNFGLLDEIYQVRLGGIADTVALTGVFGSLLFIAPPLQGTAIIVPMALAAAGGAWITVRILKPWSRQHVLESSIKLASSEPPEAAPGESGLLLGYTTDNGRPVFLSDDVLMAHLWIVGQSGVGKTVAGSLLMFQQIQRGGGLLFIDGKLDVDNIRSLYHFASWAGRAHDFFVINPGDPSTSHTYNPIKEGAPDEVAARFLSLVPETNSNAGTDYYRGQVNSALITLIGALKRLEVGYSFQDIALLLINSAALEEMETRLKAKAPNAAETKTFRIWLDRFRTPADPTGRNPTAGQLDMKRLSETFGGIAGKITQFASNEFGHVMNDYSPDVDLYTCLKRSKIVYAALPTMGKGEAASALGKMIIGDLRTAISWLQANKEDRPEIPFLCFFDEAGSYVNDQWARIFEQSRSARVVLCPAVQTFANFQAVSEVLAEMVTGNTTTKLFFRIGSQATAEECANLIGMRIRAQRTIGSTATASRSSEYLQMEPGFMQGDAAGNSYSEREMEDYHVSPDELKQLSRGECVMLHEGRLRYNLRIPMVSLDPQLVARFGDLVIRTRRKNPDDVRSGLHLLASADRLISSVRGRRPGERDEDDSARAQYGASNDEDQE